MNKMYFIANEKEDGFMNAVSGRFSLTVFTGYSQKMKLMQQFIYEVDKLIYSNEDILKYGLIVTVPSSETIVLYDYLLSVAEKIQKDEKSKQQYKNCYVVKHLSTFNKMNNAELILYIKKKKPSEIKLRVIKSIFYNRSRQKRVATALDNGNYFGGGI